MKNLIQWKPGGEFDRFMGDSLLPSFPKIGLDLAVDLYEEKGDVIVKMNLPGVDAKELDIEIDGDVLTISGSRQEEHETDEKDYYSKEIRRGSFMRSVSLPASVDAEKAHASYKDGVLSVTIPVIPGNKEKAVKVRVN